MTSHREVRKSRAEKSKGEDGKMLDSEVKAEENGGDYFDEGNEMLDFGPVFLV